ncbi:MAG: cadherin-like domain-containing protein [Oscillospiraceae bacterium]|nr:cadherin-like domain-containing protein [Oscillospiraceae bacterium]
MFRTRILCVMAAICCLVSLGTVAQAADMDADSIYCFTSTDFSKEEDLAGVCITGLPQTDTGTVMLGNRVIRSGDILTAGQLSQLTFNALSSLEDKEAVVTYLPIYENRVDQPATMAISIRGKEDKAPEVKDTTLETYKNLPNDGKLQASDPEGKDLVFTLCREPKRGSVQLRDDGTFTYTPKKNKVGVDSFTYTAADPAGNVSRKATVTIQILKPTDARQYTDTVGKEYRFAAEWMKNTGLFTGETVDGQSCFFPEKAVTRGEFLAMAVKALQIPTQTVSYEGIPVDTPAWLKPYLAAALRAGLTAGCPVSETGSFEADLPITGAEAAVMLQNALDLSLSKETLEVMETDGPGKEDAPAWAAASLTILEDNGIVLSADENLTRGEMAEVLYQVSHIAPTAPGTAVFRKQ